MKNVFQKILGIMALAIISIVIAQIDMGSGVALAFALPVGFAGPLKWNCGSENMGGYKNRVAFIPDCAVTAVPTLPDKDTVVDAGDLVTAAGAFVFKDGDSPQFIYATKGTVNYNAEPQGEIDGQSFVQTLEFGHPGSAAEVGAFARLVNNTPGYVIYEGHDGQQYMVGQKGYPANISPAFAGGAAAADRKAHTFTAEADSFCPYILLGTPIDFDELENPVVVP